MNTIKDNATILRIWKYSFWVILAGIIFLFSSCTKYKEVKEAASVFLNSRTFEEKNPYNLPNANKKTLNDLLCHSFSGFTIEDIISRGDTLFKVLIELQNPTRNITLLLQLDSIDKKCPYRVIDSWGLINFKQSEYDEEFYAFAEKIGCLQKEELSDLEINNRLDIAILMRIDLDDKMYNDLISTIKVTNQNWQLGSGNYASGSAIFHNESSHTLPFLKYEITYADIDGVTTTKEDGVISYEPFGPGDYKSFSFYTPNVANAKYAQIRPIIESTFIRKCVMDAYYDGSEYDKYLKDNKSYLQRECRW